MTEKKGFRPVLKVEEGREEVSGKGGRWRGKNSSSVVWGRNENCYKRDSGPRKRIKNKKHIR